jgi:hypothetical protein
LLHDHGSSHHDGRSLYDGRSHDDGRSHHDHTQALHHHRLSPVVARADRMV